MRFKTDSIHREKIKDLPATPAEMTKLVSDPKTTQAELQRAQRFLAKPIRVTKGGT